MMTMTHNLREELQQILVGEMLATEGMPSLVCAQLLVTLHEVPLGADVSGTIIADLVEEYVS